MNIQGFYDNNLYPARFGGAERIFRLYRHLARRAGVTVLSLLRSSERAPRSQTVDGIRIERRLPLYPTLVHYAERARLAPMHSVFEWHRRLGGRFGAFFKDPRAVYQFDSFLLTAWYDRVPRGALKVYQAVNVESDWHQEALGRLRDPAAAERSLREVERHAVEGADLILHVSQADAARLVSEFGARPERMLYVPNGFEPDRFTALDPDARAALRQSLGLTPEQRVAVFTGSRMSHNLDAARFIAHELAPAMSRVAPELRFLLIGDLPVGPIPANVRITGTVDQVPPYLLAADVALNPVISGSGTSLKMPEYLAAGLPVVTTEFGLRGFEDLRPLVTVAERAETARALGAPVHFDRDSAARALLAYGWPRQAERIALAYEAWFEDPVEAPSRWASIA